MFGASWHFYNSFYLSMIKYIAEWSYWTYLHKKTSPTAFRLEANISSNLYPRQIRDTVNWIFCEQMSVCYINVFKDTFWPNGKLAPHVKVRTDSERSETKERAQQKLLDNIPGRHKTHIYLLDFGLMNTTHLFALFQYSIFSIRCTGKSSWPAECPLWNHQDL